MIPTCIGVNDSVNKTITKDKGGLDDLDFVIGDEVRGARVDGCVLPYQRASGDVFGLLHEQGSECYAVLFRLLVQRLP